VKGDTGPNIAATCVIRDNEEGGQPKLKKKKGNWNTGRKTEKKTKSVYIEIMSLGEFFKMGKRN
jgi:hypothetical protein